MEPKKQEVKAAPRAHMIGGGSAAIVACFCVSPLEVVKTRMQSSDKFGLPRVNGRPTTSIVQSLFHILRFEGSRALFKGVIPTIGGMIPSRSIYFHCYANAKEHIAEGKDSNRLIDAASSLMAGVTTSTVVAPLWFIRTRLQLAEGRKTIRRVVIDTFSKEGPRAFYRGLLASYFGSLENVLFFVLYEDWKRALRKRKPDENKNDFSAWETLSASVTCKAVASTLFYPHEVIRTRQRQVNGPYKGIAQSAHLIFQNEGFRALYSGFKTSIVRQIPSTAITMCVYEFVVRTLSVPTTNQTTS